MEGDSSDAAKQFQILQQQQQDKLRRRHELKQKKAAKDHSFQTIDKDPLKKEGTSSTFGVEDDLELQTDDPLPKSASYMSEELVDHLNEQIRELKDENGRLFKLLSERDYEIRQLRRRHEEDKIALAGTSSMSSDSAAAKIVELSKKVRELNAALETKRTEAKQLFGRCRHLENELAKTSDASTPRLSSVVRADDASPRSRAETETELKQLNDKLRQAEQRNAEYRNQVVQVKNELKMAQKVINNEIGEGVSIHDLLNANSNWRGRAQQILALQKKIGEMKQQLEQQPMKSYRSSGGMSADSELEAEFMGAPQSKGADMKHREALRKLEKEKKEQLERSAAELKALEGDYNSLKQKLEASKARNKVLSNENKSFRNEMQKLLDKGAHDDELISALIAQQANMKTMIEQLTVIQKENQVSQEEKMSAISAKTQQENNVIQQLKSIVSEKESKVKQLEQELIQLKQARIEQSQKNSVSQLFERPQTAKSARAESIADFNQSLYEERNEEDLDMISPTPSPPTSAKPKVVSRHGSAKSINGVVNSRPPTSVIRPGTSKTDNRPNSGRRSSASRAASAHQANNQKLTEEIERVELQCQEYQSLAQAAQVERDKLMELLQLTQKRLDEANDQSLHYQNEMKMHKQNAVQLEKMLGKMKLESSSKTSAGLNRKREPSNISNSISIGSNTDLRAGGGDKLQDVETALALQKDENEALKAALESTLKAKEEDLKIYNEMIEQTKFVFLQGLRQFKNKNC